MPESIDSSATIDLFLREAAARRPVPGGGSVAALVGALATTMGEMAVNYSMGRPELAPHQDALVGAARELSNARSLFLRLMTEDQSAYQALSEATRAFRADPARRSERDAALFVAIRVPQEIASTALQVLDLGLRLFGITNRHLLSDLRVCCELACSTVRCAIHNVRANLASLDDLPYRTRLEQESEQAVRRAVGLIQQVSAAIEAAHERSA